MIQDTDQPTGRKVSQQDWNWNSWESAANPRSQRPRQRSASRQRSTSQKASQKGKGKGKKGGKVQETAMAPSPFAPYPTSPTSAPWPGQEMTPSAPSTLATTQPPMNGELINALKRAYPEGLPPDVQDLVDKTSDNTSRQLTRDLHSATTSLGRARKAFREAQAAEIAHRQAWLKHLKEATKQWEEQLDQFRRKQSQFQESKLRAGQEVEAARKLIQALNSQTAAKDTAAPLPEETEEKVVPVDAQEEEDLKRALQTTLVACAEATGVQFPALTEEIQINSDDEEKRTSAKRPKGGDGNGSLQPSS